MKFKSTLGDLSGLVLYRKTFFFFAVYFSVELLCRYDNLYEMV